MVTKQKTAPSGNLNLVSESLFEIKEKIESTHTSELVIALCGPIGSPLHDVATTVSSDTASMLKVA